MIRETAMRNAFRTAVERVVYSDKPVAQARLVKRVCRVIDNGAGIRTPRPKAK